MTELKLPAFVYDEQIILSNLLRLQHVQRESGCKVLFAIKACAFAPLIKMAADTLDGFAASSLFEAKWIKEIAGPNAKVYLTSPGLVPAEMPEVMQIADVISFNSLHQFERYAPLKEQYGFKVCLRINPEISVAKDVRYDPCAPGSKLGITLEKLKAVDLQLVDSIHFHTNCDSDNYLQLWQTAQHLEQEIPHVLNAISSINLGGGYLFSDGADLTLFYKNVALFRNKYNLEVVIEPGSALARSAGQLKVSVIDIFTANGVDVAVIDSSVNHLPEVFEYQYHHNMLEENKQGQYAYKIAGTTCLAGDHFGTYYFDRALEIGDNLTFSDCGSYSLVKAHMFNGVNLPNLYLRDKSGNFRLEREFTYDDFRRRWIA